MFEKPGDSLLSVLADIIFGWRVCSESKDTVAYFYQPDSTRQKDLGYRRLSSKDALAINV